MRLIPVGAAVLAAALVPSVARAQEVNVYSSMPLQGASKPQAQAVANGARLAGVSGRALVWAGAVSAP